MRGFFQIILISLLLIFVIVEAIPAVNRKLNLSCRARHHDRWKELVYFVNDNEYDIPAHLSESSFSVDEYLRRQRFEDGEQVTRAREEQLQHEGWGGPLYNGPCVMDPEHFFWVDGNYVPRDDV